MGARGDRCDAKGKRRRGAFFGRTEERERSGALSRAKWGREEEKE